MKKRTSKEVFKQVATMQQFFNYGHPTPQVPFTMADGGSPVNNNVTPNFYTNKLDKFIGKVKSMASKANEKSLLEDAMKQAYEMGVFQNGGTSNFGDLNFSEANAALKQFNQRMTAANQDAFANLYNNMAYTAYMNSDPYVQKIHTYDLENPYWQEDAQPIVSPDPNKAMLPGDLMKGKYGLQTYQSDEESGQTKAQKDLAMRLSVLDVTPEYRWNATSKLRNLLRGDTENSGNHGQLKKMTYHYEFGRPGSGPAGGAGTERMPDGTASVIKGNEDIWKNWQGLPGVKTEKTPLGPPLAPNPTAPNPNDPYDIYPDSWEGRVLPQTQAPLLPGEEPRLSPFPTTPVGPPMRPEIIGQGQGMPSYMIPQVGVSPFGPSYPGVTTDPNILYPGTIFETPAPGMDRSLISPETATGPETFIIPNEDPSYRVKGPLDRNSISFETPEDPADLNVIPTVDPAYLRSLQPNPNNPVDRRVMGSDVYEGMPVNLNTISDMPEGPIRTSYPNRNMVSAGRTDASAVAQEDFNIQPARTYINNSSKSGVSLSDQISTLVDGGWSPEEIQQAYLASGYPPEEVLNIVLQAKYPNQGVRRPEAEDMRRMPPRYSYNSLQVGPNVPRKGITPFVMPKQRARTTEELMAEIERMKRDEASNVKRKGGLAKFTRKYQGDTEGSEVFDAGAYENFTGEDFGNSAGLNYTQTGTASEPAPPAPTDKTLITTGQDITMGQNFGMGMYGPAMIQMLANARESAKALDKQGELFNKFSYNQLTNPKAGKNGPEDQFGNQFPTQKNFNTYYGKSGGQMYEEGGVYFLDDATIKQLKAGGAIIEYVD